MNYLTLTQKKEKDISEYLNTFYNHCNTNPHGWD